MNSRGFTAGEIAMLKPIFGDSIDYTTPLIKDNSWVSNTAITFNNIISKIWGVSLVFFLVFLLPTSTMADEKTIWVTSACYTFHMSVMDKLGNAKSKEIVFRLSDSEGTNYVAKKKYQSNNLIEVDFPDDFVDEKNGIPASINCFRRSSYKWGMFIEGKAIDSGIIGFSRD